MRVLFCCIAVLLSTTTFAQKTWQLNEVGLGFGTQNDRIQNMSMDWMRTYAYSNEAFQVALDGYDYTPYSEFFGTTLNAAVSFRKATPTGDISHELRFGATLITDREAMISYDREDLVEGGTYQESLIFCLVDDELALDMAYLVRKTGKHFSVYTGVSGMFGSTFSSQLLRIRNASIVPEDINLGNTSITEVENTTAYFSAKNAAFCRLQVPVGIEVHRKKWAFGPEFRVGVGGHSVFGGEIVFHCPNNLIWPAPQLFPE